MAKARKEVKTNTRYRFYTWLVAFLAAAQWLVGLDYITVWPGAEAQLLWSAQTGEGGYRLPVLLLGLLPPDMPYWLFWYRFPGLLLSGLGLWWFYRWGRPLFGQTTLTLVLLAGAANLFLPFVLKTASLNSWAFGPLLAAWVASLNWIKQPHPSWRWRALFSGLAVVLVGGVAGFIVLLFWYLAYAFWYGRRYEGVRMAQVLRPLIVPGFVGLAFTAMAWVAGEGRQLTFFAGGYGRFLLYSLLGTAPLLGFMAAGLRDLVYKLRRGEEMALILLVGLVGSLLVQSIVFPFLLSFLAAKQMDHYFGPHPYPWEPWAKGVQVLHLLVVFFAVIAVLLGGFLQFQAEGFRAVLGTAAGYWMFSLLGVIGLYGQRSDYAQGGLFLAGALSLLLFWVQVYPYLHLRRNWPSRLVEQLDRNLPVVIDTEARDGRLVAAPYLRHENIGVLPFSEAGDSGPQLRGLTAEERADTAGRYRVRVQGWKGLWEEGEWVVE